MAAPGLRVARTAQWVHSGPKPHLTIPPNGVDPSLRIISVFETYDPTAAPSPLYRSLPDALLPPGPPHLRRQSLRDAHPHRVATAQPVPNRVHGNGGGIMQLQFPHQVGAVFFDRLGT